MYHSFPNFSFRTYVTRKYREKKVFETNVFTLRFLQIIPFLLWDIVRYAFIELLLVSLFVLVLFEMSQGRDMVVSFFEPDGLFSAWRLVLTTLSIILYSISMWIIPAYLFELKDKYQNRKLPTAKNRSAFWKHLFFVHRTLAMIPFWGFAMLIHHQAFIHYTILGLATLQCLGLYLFYNTRLFRKIRRLTQFSILGITAILLVYVLAYYQIRYFEVKAAFSLFLIFLSVCMYMLYFRIDWAIISEKQRKKPAPGYYPINTIIYAGLFLINLALLCCLIWFFDLNAVVPESLMLAVFSSYVFFFDFVYYLTSIKRTVRYIFNGSLIVLAIGLLALRILPNYSHFEMECRQQGPDNPAPALAEIDDYFNVWVERIKNRSEKNRPYPIVLVSGEGGGSRAGFWFSQTLMQLDLQTNGKFRDHIFSISTVSGSSIGLGAVFSWWDYCDQNQIVPDPKWKAYPRQVFKHNYIGSGIHGMMTTDFWKCFVPFVDWDRNRNDELQDQEAVYIQRALDNIQNGKDGERMRLFSRHRATPGADSALIMKRSITSFYYDPHNSSITARKPLIFLNTCRSSDGRRGIFAPVKLGESEFSDAIDMCRYIYSDSFTIDFPQRTIRGMKSSISLGAACNTTELFPIFSAPAFVHNLGSFVDGGYHDNSGLKTTLDVHRKLVKLLTNAQMKEGKDYTIYILYIKNVRYGKSYYPDTARITSPLIQPALAITNVPFNSNGSYFEEHAATSLKQGYFIRFQLQYLAPSPKEAKLGKWTYKKDIESQINDDIFSYNPATGQMMVNYPLARWLSRSIIDKMEYSFDKELERNRGLVQLIGFINAENPQH